jgi:membrane associated rhomboid family serine protease
MISERRKGMFPLQDLNPTRRLPILTYLLIGLNVLVFIWEMSLTEIELAREFLDLAVVPANFDTAPIGETILDIIRSMFLHGGYDHIIGNMLYLYLFGDNIEDRLGKILFLILYFASGFAAVGAQYVIDPNSTIPMIGASGAIAGVLGSYLILYPTVKVRGIVPLGAISTLQEWPAFIVLGLWFVLQLFNGIVSLGPEFQGGGVAFFAHIGGFVAGVILTFLFMMMVPQPPKDRREQSLYAQARRHRF